MATATAANLGIDTPRSLVTWAGRALSGLVVLALAMSAFMKLSAGPQVAEQFVQHMGYPAGTLVIIGIVELAIAALYAVPRTSVLGAILVAAYLGGATATHVRISDAFVVPVVLGVLAWLGLYLRDTRLRALVPLRSTAKAHSH